VAAAEGPSVLLLHGIASSIYTWKDVLPALAAHHDVIAVDFPGFGDSAIPPHASGERILRTVVGLMDRLGIARASIVGNSLGGAIAVAQAATLPDRVSRLVLLDPAGYNFAPADRPFVLPGRPSPPVLEALPIPDGSSASARSSRRPAGDAGVPIRRACAAGRRRRPPRSPPRDRRPAFPGRDPRRARPRWSGGYDTWIPPRDAGFAADIPGARVVLVETGHMPQEERPAETAALIEEFLKAEVSAPVRPGSPAPSAPPSSPGTR
jgi:pimeloyl-ACP methyl ester carboxylesterase